MSETKMNYKLPPLPALPPVEVEEWSESGITFRGEGWKKETVEKYATAYAIAALEQQRHIEARGVPDGWQSEVRSILDDQKAGGPPVNRVDWSCLCCGNWTPPNHPEAHDHKESCTAAKDWRERLNWKRRLERLLASAPPAPLASVVQQEPVAWICEEQTIGPNYGKKRLTFSKYYSDNPLHYKHTPLYPHPAQQAKPQPLSDEHRG